MESNNRSDSKEAFRTEIPKGASPTSEETAADRPAFEPPRARRPRPARTAILAFVAIMLALFAFFRVYFLLDDENLPAVHNTLPTKPACRAQHPADETCHRRATER
jgi:hypothetical protein